MTLFKGFVKAHRGLRQRDLLSPFLFVIVGEALGRMFSMASGANLICGGVSCRLRKALMETLKSG